MTSAWPTSAAGLREAHPARTALDELRARLALEGGDLLADRRLRVRQRLGRGGEGALGGDLPQDQQATDIEH
ncbi:MAG: hypothetical protein M3P39_00960 [Actinomycetota bacterium]|nr:hypothetical protein [Actinomycetota bacterium]